MSVVYFGDLDLILNQPFLYFIDIKETLAFSGIVSKEIFLISYLKVWEKTL